MGGTGANHVRDHRHELTRWGRIAGDGAIAGDGEVIKKGTGTLVVSGINSHSGRVTIDAGTLVVTGQVASPITPKTNACSRAPAPFSRPSPRPAVRSAPGRRRRHHSWPRPWRAGRDELVATLGGDDAAIEQRRRARQRLRLCSPRSLMRNLNWRNTRGHAQLRRDAGYAHIRSSLTPSVSSGWPCRRRS